MRRKYNAPFCDLHRVDLQVALYDRAKQLGVKVRLGARVADVDFEAPLIRLESGEELRSDLIVAADGLWSKSREKYLAAKGTSDEPLPTGDLAYRIVLRLEDLEDDRELYDWVANPSCNFWIGPEAHVVAYSVRGGTMLNIVLLVLSGASKIAPSVREFSSTEPKIYSEARTTKSMFCKCRPLFLGTNHQNFNTGECESAQTKSKNLQVNAD